MSDVNLGDDARDKVTGFTGTVTGYAVYLYGSAQYLIQPRTVTEGLPAAPQWFDKRRVERVRHSQIGFKA